MNGMLGMLELLSFTRLDTEQRATLEIVRESSRSLMRIIDDILDFSKMEAGKLDVRTEVCSIARIIEDVHSIYGGNASSKGLLIRRHVDPRISPAVHADPLRLRQILNNFVSNSLKFTSEGFIAIEAELLERTGGEDRVRFSVRDTGIGISAQDQLRLFQPFNQGDGEAARKAGGTGLGLSICRRLAELMGGTVDMVSEPGKGTTMFLTLTLRVAPPQDLAKPERQAPVRAPEPGRPAPSVAQAEADGTLVLLADDHPTNRALLARQLHMLGFACETAPDGLQALDMWRTGRFATIITDCHMPKMDGYELARSIRRLESADGDARIPIIACTANALSGEAEICLAAGMDDYLSKPVELSALLNKLEQWLPGRQTLSDPIDVSVIAATWGNAPSTTAEILAAFRQANDEDAGMLRQAVELGDIAKAVHASHRMLGAGRMVGAHDFALACEQIEHAGRTNDWPAVLAAMQAFEDECVRLNEYINSVKLQVDA